MSWTLRSPLSFPAFMPRVMREAVAFAGRPVLFGSYRTEDAARAIGDQWRQFRWCLRQQPGVAAQLYELECCYQFRLSSETDYQATDRWVVLYLTATPDRVSEIIALNPHLAALAKSAA